MRSSVTAETPFVHEISVVVPVYGGEKTLPPMIDELAEFHTEHVSPDGHRYRVMEVLLCYDHGRDASDAVIRSLARQYDFVHGVWLSRNFGQHPATLAGMSQSHGDWVVTMDEDGQHDPKAIAEMLDTAMRQQADVVYADPVNRTSSSPFRNITSHGAKFAARVLLGSTDAQKYQSFRLILGDIARILAKNAGAGTYLDIALGWICNRVATCPVVFRSSDNRRSSYNLVRLIGHFWSMVLTGGTRPLRFVSMIGGITAAIGIIWAVVLACLQLFGKAFYDVHGWTSLIVAILVFSGLMLLAIGIVAEYIGVIVRTCMGKPAYVIVSDSFDGPLREHRTNQRNDITREVLGPNPQNFA